MMMQSNRIWQLTPEDASGGVPATGPYSTSSPGNQSDSPGQEYPGDRAEKLDEAADERLERTLSDEGHETTLGAEENEKLNDYTSDPGADDNV